jgi:acyl transferase domain-containing protein/phosphopantetheinyl transferase
MMIATRAEPMDTTARDEIAIIGMACMFPGAPDLQSFWQAILEGVDATSDPPPDAWDAQIHFDPDSQANDRVYCKRGGYLGPLAEFNPLAYNVMPNSLLGSEPDQWLALKVAQAALADAGYGGERLEQRPDIRARTAIILGKGTYLNHGNLNMVQHSLVVDQTLAVLRSLHPEYDEAALAAIRAELKRRLPPFNADAAQGLVPNIIVGRIANKLDLMGPSYTVDAACASALVAVEAATRDLLAGNCDLALVGGAQVTTPLPILTLFCQLGALSRRQQIRPFDREADGTILGEGIGMIVLKRRAAAERDGDRIYAVIKGVGVASDGRGLGLLAPRVEGETLALTRAYAMAQVSPQTVGLIEAHGTATPAGDLAEIQAIGAVFGGREGSLPRCALGSVKSMIGHTLPAAGIAGMIKAVLALAYKVLPPTLNCDHPHPRLAEETSCYVNTTMRPWISGGPRRAGVNAFGFGGINAHVVLEEVPETGGGGHLRRRDSELLIIGGDSREQLLAQGRELANYLAAAPAVALLDLAYTLNAGAGNSPCRLAIVAASVDDLRQKLSHALAKLESPSCRQIKDQRGVYYFAEPFHPSGSLALLFPGEGSQYAHMLADICLHFPEARACFDRIDRVFADHPRGYAPSDFIFPRPNGSDPSVEEQLWQIDGAIEAVLTANQALLAVLRGLGLRPDAVAGHSTGEYSAMRAAGVIPLDDERFVGDHLLELNRMYREVSKALEVPRGALLAVGAGVEQIRGLSAELGGEIHVALDNCPHQTVVVVSEQLADRVVARMRGQGMIYELLPFDRAYHTPFFAPYGDAFVEFFRRLPLAPPQIPIYSCTTAAPYPNDIASIRSVAARNASSTVRFRETVEAMYADGVRLLVECGARGNLTAFAGDILRGRPHLAIAANLQHRTGLTQLNHLAGLLCAQGLSLQLDYLYTRCAPRRLTLDPAVDGVPARGTFKLATGWPAMDIGADAAARLHGQAGQPAQGKEILAASRPSANGSHVNGSHGPLRAFEAVPDVGTPSTSGPSLPGQEPAAGHAMRAAVVNQHLELMEQFLVTQQSLMEQFLARSGQAALPTPQPAPAESAPPPASAPVLAEEASAAAPLAAALSTEQIAAILTRLLCEKTGYPAEMIDPTLDLEADLGIDSIKRVEILGSFQRETGLLDHGGHDQVLALKTLSEIIDAFAALNLGRGGQQERPAPAPAERVGFEARVQSDNGKAATGPGLAPLPPLIDEIIAHSPGQELRARVRIDLGKHHFMRDHTLGRVASSADPALLALPIVPLTISMEILAEAAALLLPGRTFVGMRNLRAYRWILVEDEAITLRVQAQRRPGSDEVEVSLREEDDTNAQKLAVLEGLMCFAESYPTPPTPQSLTLRGERASRWRPETLYTTGLFHGPRFQAVASIERWGEDGAEATLKALPTDDLLHAGPAPSFLAEPVILDAAGQLIGFWTLEGLERGFVVFPYQLDELHIYGPPLRAPEQARCAAQIALTEDERVRSDITIVGPDGSVRIALVGWADKRFDIPRRLYELTLAPTTTLLSQEWPALGEGTVCRWIAPLPERLFEAHQGFWEKVLAYLVLSRAERAHWRELKVPVRRRIDWLLGRVAAKEAVRVLLAGVLPHLAPADIEIVADARGRPLVQGSWQRQLARPLQISIAHAGGAAIALAGWSDEHGRPLLGVDLEPLTRASQEFADVAFDSGERALFEGLDAEQQAGHWPLRLWCAKEAAGKALGQGLAEGPRGLTVVALKPQSGEIELMASNSLLRRLPELAGRVLSARSTIAESFVVACVIE